MDAHTDAHPDAHMDAHMDACTATYPMSPVRGILPAGTIKNVWQSNKDTYIYIYKI